jgi:hypothetical protein
MSARWSELNPIIPSLWHGNRGGQRFNKAAGCRTVAVDEILVPLFHMATKCRAIVAPVSIEMAPVIAPVPPCFHNRGRPAMLLKTDA